MVDDFESVARVAVGVRDQGHPPEDFSGTTLPVYSF